MTVILFTATPLKKVDIGSLYNAYIPEKMAFDKAGLFRHVTYSVIGANALQKGAKQYLPHMQAESACTENTFHAKESKQIILQTKLIIVEILNVSCQHFVN